MTTLSAKHILLMAGSALMLMACGGGGGSSSTPVATPPPPPPPTGGGGTQTPVSVTLSGTLTFDRVPNNPVTNALNFNATTQMPIRFAPVELVSGTTVLDSTVSDENGAYSFTLDSGQNVSVRVLSEIQRTEGNIIDFQVVDNTSNNALYALQGAASEVPPNDQTRDLNAGSGWGGSSYVSTRAAAPFALLDTIYATLEDIIAVDPNVNFPAFDVLWSVQNRAVQGDVSDGEIGTSSFTISNGVPVIRILGDENNDTDEFDVHVVVHEFGHYFENTLSRADSIGGPHSLNDRLDARVAFGEGWGNALSGMILDDPLYRDSFGPQQSQGFSFNVESNNIGARGWFSESSVQSILYDIFDSDNDGVDTVSLGLGPIYDAFVSEDYQNTEAFTSIFSFMDAIDSQPGVTPSDLTPLLTGQNITSRNEFALGETDNGGLPDQLPLYLPVQTNGTPVNFCSVDTFGTLNKHGNRRYLTFDVATGGTFTFNMVRTSGPANSDPDFTIFSRGQFIANAISGNDDQETISVTLDPGTYVIDGRDFRNERDNLSVPEACFNFTIQ